MRVNIINWRNDESFNTKTKDYRSMREVKNSLKELIIQTN